MSSPKSSLSFTSIFALPYLAVQHEKVSMMQLINALNSFESRETKKVVFQFIGYDIELSSTAPVYDKYMMKSSTTQ